MKLRKVILMMAAMLALGSTAYAAETTEAVTEAAAETTEAVTEAAAETTEAVTEAAAETAEAVTEAAAGGEALTLSDDWTDFQLQIDDTVYQFPMDYETFASYGWTTDDDLTQQLEPYQYSMVWFESGERTCTAFILNLGINNMPLEECLVAGISIDAFDWEVSDGKIVLPGGLTRGEADGAKIEELYGTPSDTYEGDSYTEYTYELNYDSSISVKVDKETGVMTDVEMRNFVAPEGFSEGEIDSTVPAEVTAYQKPGALSTDMTAYEIELDGQVYALPVPVSTLLADGWKLNPSETDEYVMANSSGWVGLIKGGQSFHVMARNAASYATLPENCWIEELEVGGFTLELDGALTGGVRIGITEEELLALFEKAGMTYEAEESSSFKYYTYNDAGYGHTCQAMVYTGEDEHFPKGTVASVTCTNFVE